MKKYQNGFAPILVLVLVAAVGFVLFFVYKNFGTSKLNMTVNVPSNSPLATVVPILSPVSDPTENWKTYTNPLKEYTFKYPAEAKSDTEAGGAGAESIRVSYMGKKQIASGRTETSLADGYAFVVTKAGTLPGTTADSIATQWHQSSLDTCPSPSNVGNVISTTVTGIAAKKFTTTNCYGNTTEYFLSNGKSVFAIDLLYVGDAQDLPDYQRTAESIFSSFKFTQ